MEPIRYRTSSPAGDLISFLAGIKKMYEDTGSKGIVYQRVGMPGVSYSDSIHPFENEEKEPVTMNRYMFDMLQPLLKSQPYIEDFIEHRGEEVDFDFDLIRMERYTNQPHASLNRWFNYVFPQMASDLSKKWLLFEESPFNTHKPFGILNFTQRHRNHFVNYFFLKPHQEHLVFAGLQKERDIFCRTWDLDIPLLQVDNFLDLAKAINGCRFFMGNASMCFQIAEATKCKRMLEIFPVMPNVIPIGEYALDYYHQGAAEYYFNQLINE